MFDWLKTCDRYQLGARFVPGILCSLPAVLLVWIAKNEEVSRALVSGMWSWISMAGVQFLIAAGAVQYITSWGKRYEDQIFDKGLRMPTTEKLLWGNSESSESLKRKVRAKLKDDFGIKLPSKEAERKNEHAARVEIRDAVARIRLRVGNGVRVHEHNIRYGFIRNLAAGARFALLVAIMGIGLAGWLRNSLYVTLFAVMMLGYGVAMITGRKMIVCHGEHYSDQLLNEYADNGGKEK